MEKRFFEAFPNLKLDGVQKDLFEQVMVERITATRRRDLLRIIYISIYAGNRSNNYMIRRTRERTQIAGFSLPYFDIIRKDT